MSLSNLDLVRSIYAAWERGDFSSAEWAHSEIEFVAADGAETGKAGLAATADGVREFLSAWEEFRVEADEYRDLDDQRVLVLDHRSGRGKTSGLDLGQVRTTGARLFHIRNGKVTRLVIYLDRDCAFADLRLSGEGNAAQP
jgi:ketosteroid isomerase-like protein